LNAIPTTFIPQMRFKSSRPSMPDSTQIIPNAHHQHQHQHQHQHHQHATNSIQFKNPTANKFGFESTKLLIPFFFSFNLLGRPVVVVGLT